MRVGLVGCVKGKLDHAAPARELYTSALFLGRRDYVERSCDRWFLLSALHGLVDPDAVLDPYDLTLLTMPAPERRAWSDGVLTRLVGLVPLSGTVFELHAGKAYADNGLSAGLVEAGAILENPTAGLRMGQQLAFYKAQRQGVLA